MAVRQASRLHLSSSRRPSSHVEHHTVGSLKRIIDHRTFLIWTYWTITSGPLCWKSVINSSWSPRRSDSCFYATYRAFINCFSSSRWVESRNADHLHKNTLIRQRQTSLNAWLLAWLPMVRSSAVRVHFQVCFFISAPKNWLFAESPTYYRRKQRPKCS